jgi:serine/threonine protein kinase
MARSLFQDYSSSNGDGRRKQQNFLHEMEEITLKYLSKMEQDSVFFAPDDASDSDEHVTRDRLRPIPQFEPNEIQLETMIGMGEFGVLLKVKGIFLSDEGAGNERNGGNDHAESIHDGLQTRHHREKQQQHYPSSINLSSQEEIQSSTGIPERVTSSGNNSAGALPPGFGPRGGVRLSQSITVAELASPPASPVADRMGGMPRLSRCSVLSPYQVAMTKDGPHHLAARNSLAQQANSSLAPGPAAFDDVDSSSLDPMMFLPATRFAIKQVRKDLYPKKKIEAAKDLAREAKFLARIDHPNIVALRGLVSEPGRPEFGILLDRLRITLSEELARWHRRQEEIVASSSSRISLLSPVEVLAANIRANWPFFSQPGPQQQQQSQQHDRQCNPASSQDDGKTEQQRLLYCQNVFDNPEASVLLGERVLALYDVAQAMQHLHRYKIVFRDLKTENVGALGNHRFQIFDFGLAKECKPTDRWRRPPSSCATLTQHPFHDGGKAELAGQQGESTVVDTCNDSTMGQVTRYNDGGREGNTTGGKDMGQISGTKDDADDDAHFSTSYQMTGLTGTLRIMAPEVIQCLPYGLSADVYSFAICMWEAFSGQRSLFSAAEICKGLRPTIPKFERSQGSGLPPRLHTLLEKCWGADPKSRPTFGMIRHELERQLADLQVQQEERGRLRTSRSRGTLSSNNSRDSSPQGRNWHGSNSPTVSSSAQAAFWNRLEMIRPASLVE